jgi:hypothetical protein
MCFQFIKFTWQIISKKSLYIFGLCFKNKSVPPHQTTRAALWFAKTSQLVLKIVSTCFTKRINLLTTYVKNVECISCRGRFFEGVFSCFPPYELAKLVNFLSERPPPILNLFCSKAEGSRSAKQPEDFALNMGCGRGRGIARRHL